MTNERRREIEALILKRLIAHLLEEGCMLSVNDGEEYTVTKSIDPVAIFNALQTTDEDKIVVRDSTAKYIGNILLVYGNDGYDVIADNSDTPHMNGLLKPVEDYAREFEMEHDFNRATGGRLYGTDLIPADQDHRPASGGPIYVSTMGKSFAVRLITTSQDEANKFMWAHSETALYATFGDHFIIADIAETQDA